MAYTISDAIFRDKIFFHIPKVDIKDGQNTRYTYFYTDRLLYQFYIHKEAGREKYSIGNRLIYYKDSTLESAQHVFENSYGGEYSQDLTDYNIVKSVVEGDRIVFCINNRGMFSFTRQDVDDRGGTTVLPGTQCPGCGEDKLPDEDCGNEDCEENPNFNPNPEANPPVILDIKDITVYQNTSTQIKFYAYAYNSSIKASYFGYTPNEPHAKLRMSYLGNSTYTAPLLFGSLGEYEARIKVVDGNGLSAISNTFKITVIPPIADPMPAPVVPTVSKSEHIILYDKKSKEFESNGLGVLNNATYCIVEQAENSLYEVELHYPIGSKFDDYLLDTEYIIKCNVDNCSNSQLFRIYDSEYIMQDKKIVVKGRHITYDLKDDFIEGISLLSTTCKVATQTLISNVAGQSYNNFSVTSDIETKKNFSISMTNILEAMIGTEGSILETYGNENTVLTRDNFNFKIENKLEDKGFVIAYRKNMLGFSRKINIEEVVTKIYPYTVLDYGKVFILDEKFITSSNASKYSIEKIKAVEFSNDDITSQADLRSKANNYFAETKADIPKVSYEIDFTLIYDKSSNLSSLERLCIGDTVTINDENINLSLKARVIRISYNALTSKFEKIELGNFRNEYRKQKKQEYQKLVKDVRRIIN